MTTKKIKFNIAENTSDDSRASHITFASGNGVSQNIKIIQQGALPVIHVETAGTLSRLINSSVKDEITKLKITGNLNSTDTEFLRKMKKIQVLDLSEVNMTKLGYYSFQLCNNLTSIIIPSSVTSIGEGAFWGCSRMREIHIGYKSVSGMNPSVFENVDTSVCVLYVPRGCKNAYSIADGWRSFKNIVEE